MTDVQVPDAIADAPPGTKLVWICLEADGPLTQRQLVARTHLDQRTVQRAVEALDDHALLSTKPVVHDARQTYYGVG